MSTSTPDPTAGLPALPRGMQWRVTADGRPRVRLRVFGKHQGTFDTVQEALAAQAAIKRGEKRAPTPPQHSLAVEAAPHVTGPDRSAARPQTWNEMYTAFSIEAHAGRYQSKRNGAFTESTLRNYHDVWERHCNPRLGAVPFTAYGRPQIIEQLNGISAESGHQVAIKARSILQTTARFAMDYFGVPVYLQIERKLRVKEYRHNRRRERRMRIIQPNELVPLLEGAAERDARMKRSLALPLILLLVKHGPRPSEALCLRLGHDGLDLEAGMANIVSAHLPDPDEEYDELLLKTDESERGVPLEAGVVDVLGRHVAATGARRGDLVFRMKDGRPVSLSVLRREVRAAAELAGLPAPLPRPYDLRRTYVSYAFAAGVDEAVIARLLGHVHSGSLARQLYRQALDRKMLEAADKIEEFLRRWREKQ